MKLLIKNGRVVHPVTSAVVLQDILADNGVLAMMERGIDVECDQVIDAKGLIVAPGLWICMCISATRASPIRRILSPGAPRRPGEE